MPMDSAERFHVEKARLLESLGWLTEGGVIEQLAPLGAGAQPGAEGSAPLQVGITTWPFPPEEATLAALSSLGYLPSTERPAETVWQFHRLQDGAQLLIAEAGCTAWTIACLLRDFAKTGEAARARVAAAGWNPELAGTLLDDATAWWLAEVGFAPLRTVTEEMSRYPGLWGISSGWALDLFLRRPTRIHRDVDLIVDRSDQFALRTHLEERGFKFVTPFEGRLEPWPPHMRLELPRHQIHAHRENDFLDILLTDFTSGVWHYRRDPSILRSQARAFCQTEDGLRYLAPELVLLFKSKNTGDGERPRDQRDFELVLPHLDAEARAWLHWALTAADPEHPWLTITANVK